MSAQAIQAGEAFVKLNIQGDEIQKSLNKIGEQFDQFGTKVVHNLKDITKLVGNFGINLEQIDSGVNLFSDALCRIGNGFSFIKKVHLGFTELASSVQGLTIAQIAQERVQKLGTVGAYLSAAGLKAMSVAQNILNISILGCPLGWLIGGLASVGGAITGVMWLFGAFKDNVAENAKAMEELCKQNDTYRDSAKKCMATLEEYSKVESLNSNQCKTALNNWDELCRTAHALDISLYDLGITFDKHNGKIHASSEAMAEFKEVMRKNEFEDLNKTINAQEEYLDDLNDKLKNSKTWSWRSFGTYVSFGYVDNAEEIQEKINETREKIQNNLEKQKVVADFSVEYKENEAKLKEIYEKEAEASKNALAVKIDGIKKEYSEREAILRQLIDEANARMYSIGLSKEEKANLEARKAALAGLNAEQEERIRLLREEQAAKFQKIQDDYQLKIDDNKKNKAWSDYLESSPEKANDYAQKEFKEADSAFNAAIEAAKAIDENTSKEEIERLNAEVERTRKEADKWNARKEESAKKVADIEKKAAEDAQKAAEEDAKAKQKAAEKEKNRLKQLDDIEKNYKSKNAEGDENKAWNKSLETDANGANRTAVEEFNKAEAAFNKALEAARNATENTSKEELERLNDEVARTQKEAEKWRARKDESANKVAENEKRKEDEQSSRLQQIEDLRNGKQEERAKKEEQESWKEEVKTDSGEARNRAQSELDKLNGQSAAQYAKLQELAKSGSSEAYQKQLAAVRKMEEDIDLWQSRINEIDIAELEASKESTKPADIQVLAAGTMDAQKKFLELQQATKNPLEEKMDESNRLLRRVAESSENLEGQMEAV